MAVDPQKDYPFWTDVLGQQYGPGDIVSISTISGKSPQLVVAEVVRIARKDSKGELITCSAGYDRATNTYLSKPSCKVVALPLVDARGFSRWGRWNSVTKAYDKPTKTVTYSIPQNIVKLAITADELREQLAE